MEIGISTKVLKKSLAVTLAFLIALSSMWTGLGVVGFAAGENFENENGIEFMEVDGNVTDGNVRKIIETGSCGEKVKYTLYSDGELIISGSGKMCSYSIKNLNLPPYDSSSVKKVIIKNGVTSIGDCAFFKCRNLTSVTIPDSVTSIGARVFDGCGNLTEINVDSNNKNYVSVDDVLFNKDKTTLVQYPVGKPERTYSVPDTVTNICGYAFSGCTSLTSVTIPDSVTSIGDRVFEFCNSLTSVTIPDSVTSIGDSAFYSCNSLTSIIIPDSVTSIGKSMFWNCTSLTSVTISNSVTSIGDGAFSSCDSLTSVTIPDSVTSIGERAFSGCDSLTIIIIPDSVTSIGDSAFSNCDSLTSVTIPDSVTSIGDSAFYSCDSLTRVTIGKGTTSISSTAFSDSSLMEINVVSDNESYSSIDGVLFNKDKTEIIKYPEKKTETSYSIPNTVTSIGDYAFRYCNSLTSVTIPDSVTSIGEEAFRSCRSLTSIIIPGSVKCLEFDTFGSCDSLTNITIVNGVVSIGENVFRECDSLKKVIIPDSVMNIEDYAFFICPVLTSVTILNREANIGDMAFFACNDDLVIHGYKGSSAEIYANENGIKFKAIDGKVTDGNVTDGNVQKVLAADSCGNNITYTLYSDGRLVLEGTGEMWDCSYNNIFAKNDDYESAELVKKIEIGEGITSIGKNAFYSCDSLTNVTIGNSVKSIGDYAFNDCGSLISITIPDSVTVIGDYAFGYCDNLTSVTIPDSVTSIGRGTFLDCDSLTSVTIPDSVTSIGDNAFNYCANLVNINVTSDNEYYCSVDGVLFNKDKTIIIKYPEGKTETSYSITDSVTSIGEDAFYSCDSLKSVAIPDSVTSIGDYAFASCYSLTSVTIPDSVTSIGDGAFNGCDSLKSVTIPDSVTSIGDSAFGYCANLVNINVASDNEYYCSVDGVLFNKDKTIIIKYPEGKTETSYSITDSVTSIGEDAFARCYSLTSVTIPDSVTSIGEGTFYSCNSLTSVTIPDSVTVIGDYAFGYCDNLTSVTIPDSVTSIGNRAFSWCNVDLVIHGYKGSSAEIYANKNGIKFKAIDGKVTDGNVTDGNVTDGNVTDGNVTDGNINECQHTNKQTVAQQDATCTTDGYTAGTYCPDCKAWLDGHEVIKAKHSYNSVVTNPTCTEKGYTTHICTACGNGYTDSVVDALGHDWNTEWTVDKKATCSAEGSKSYHCKRCDEKKDVTTIEKEPHTPTTYTQKASCTVNGYTLTSCSACGDELSFEVLKATNHENKYTVAQQDATCTTDGYTAGTYCPDCKAWLDGHEVIKAKHSYNSVVTNPTCTEKGYTTHTCTACGNGYTDSVVDALGHDWNTEWTVDKKATCSAEGSKSYHCKRCDEKKDVTAIEKEPHTPTTYTQKASCTVNGYTLTSCSACGDELSFEVLKATNHEKKHTVAQQDATCTTDGYTAGTYCPDCKAWLDGHEVIKAKHSYNSVVTNPTCTEKGYTTHTCTACGNGYTDSVVDALGHDWNTEWTVDKKATCSVEGSKSYHCKRCDEKKDVTAIEKEPHTPTTYTQKASCTVNGYTLTSCSACGDELSFEVLNATNHEKKHTVAQQDATCTTDGYTAGTYCPDCKAWLDGHEVIKAKHSYNSVVTNPTCTEKGYTTYICIACGNGYTDSVVDALGHDYGKWTVAVEATLLNEGKEVRSCSRCPSQESKTIAKLKGEVTKDDNSGVKIEYTDESYGGENMEVIVEEDFNGSQYLGQSYGNFVSWDIKTYVNGIEAQPDAPVLVTIPIPAGFDKNMIVVYHVNSITGKLEKIEPVVIEGDSIKFLANSFSTYIVVDEGSCDDGNPSENCSCNCHKKGIMAFLWKIICFFCKLFRTNSVCDCGVAHY